MLEQGDETLVLHGSRSFRTQKGDIVDGELKGRGRASDQAGPGSYRQRTGVGGGILITNSHVTISNCIVWNNVADVGSEIAIGDVIDYYGPYPSRVTVSHSDVEHGEGGVFINPNMVGWNGEPIDPNLIDPNTLNWDANNMDVDPCFAVAGYWHHNSTPADANDDFWVDGDYHLKSQAGRWQWSVENECCEVL